MAKKKKRRTIYLKRLRSEWPNLYKQSETGCIVKSGDEYIDAVIALLNKKRKKKLNQSDYPIRSKDILKTHTLDEFKEKFCHPDFNEYKKIGFFQPNYIKFSKRGTPQNNESVELVFDNCFSEIVNTVEGVAYFITAEKDKKEYLIKIGETRKTFAERTKSYNCGCLNNVDTASKTNIRILQTIIANTDFKFNFYLMDCSKNTSTFEFGGEESKPYPTSYRIAVQDLTLQKYMDKFHEKPIGNVQAESTKRKKNNEKDRDEQDS